MSPHEWPEIKKSQTLLRQSYGDRLKDVILFGSVARGQDTPESDIDLLVLLDEPFDYWTDLKNIVDLLHPLQLESQHYISPKPARYDDYKRQSLQFYKNIKREGVSLT